VSAFPYIPSRHLIALAAMRPEAPSCPDFGFPSYPASSDRCTHPWIEVYDAPCDEETINCILFRSQHFAWRQSRLASLVSRRPDPDSSSSVKYTWCSEVLRLVVDLADDTNIRHGFLSGWEVPDHLERTRAYLNSVRPMHGGVEVPLMFPEMWFTGTGNEAIPNRASMIGHHVLSFLGPRVDKALGSYLWMPPGRTGGYMLEHVRTQHALEKPRPVPVTARTRDMTAEVLTMHIFDAAPGPGAFLVGRVERATGGAPCAFVGPAARECFHYERFPVAIAGAEATMDLLEANALDWIHANFEVLINAGFRRYATYLLPYAEEGMLALDPDELREQIIAAERREAQAAVGTAMGIAGAVASAIPVVGGIVAAVIAVVGAVISILLEVLPMAWGGGACPVLGFRRMLTDPECAAPTPQGNPNIAALLTEYHVNVAMRPTAPGAGEEPDDDDAPPEDTAKGGVPVAPLVGAAAVAAVLVGVAVARRRKNQRAAEEEDA